MWHTLLFCIPIWLGQTEPAYQPPAVLCPPAASTKCYCPIDWLRPWTHADLQMKSFEPVPTYCGCKGLLWCPPKEEDKENGKKNGGTGKDTNGPSPERERRVEEGKKTAAEAKDTEKKNGKDAGKEGEKKEGEEEKKEEEPKTLTPLMQMLQCYGSKHYHGMQKRGDNFYGWLQHGFTANFSSPRDRTNYGVNFNWRSNDYRLNQLYFVFENTLEHEDQANVGYRIDFITGHDAPYLVANGLFSDFTGFDPTSGFGVAGPTSFRRMDRIGIDLPQFYLDVHIPHFLTHKGVDLRIGKFYTLMGREVYPGKDTDFYSRTLENVIGTAYTHTGILTTIHATDTLDVILGVVRGWDTFEDNNDRVSYHNALIWNSCDKRYNWTTTFTTGPEQFRNNGNYRTVLTSYLTVLFGIYNEWKLVTGGLLGYEANAAAPDVTGRAQDAEWYDYSVHLFYTVDPCLILGLRGEWFRDDDATRTAFFNRPGFAASFYNFTAGFTYKPYQNLRVRPELRFDWTPDARPFNDQRDKFMTTAAFDVIWEF
jgi:Putative beta-barrel porin-2, OmpL-like. bbp2